MILEERAVKKLLEEVVAANSGRDIGIGVSGEETGSTRFANNAITTNGSYNRLEVYAEVVKGQKKGIATVNQLEKEKLQEAVDRASILADLAPENEELMPPLGPQTYPQVRGLFAAATADFSPGQRLDAISAVVARAGRDRLNASGFFETSSDFSAYLNSRGLYYYLASSRAYYSNTLRSADGGSGWAAAEHEDVGRIDTAGLAATALDKALTSGKAKPLPPGKYTVILEPAAVADLVWFLIYNLSAREADEGRSCFSLANGKNRLGKIMMAPQVTIYSDPLFPDLPAAAVGEDGLAVNKTVWIDRGVVRNLNYSRFWAQKQGGRPVPGAVNLIMAGGDHSLADLIGSTPKGVLISRFWYIRDLNPMILLLTGLTRDGTYLIENGKIKHPVNNFRFNESPINVLRHVQMMSRPLRAVGGETGQPALVPALKVKEFNFSSVSDAV